MAILRVVYYNIQHAYFCTGYPEVVFLLLNAGLDVKQKDSFGQVFGSNLKHTFLFNVLHFLLY